MNDLEIDQILFEASAEAERVPEDLMANAQARAEASGLPCSFESPEMVTSALGRASHSAKAVLRAALGLSGPIEWPSLIEPWMDAEGMENRLGQQGLWIPTEIGSYSHETVTGFHAARGVSARAHLFESDLEKLLGSQDPAAPLVLRASFYGEKPRDERLVGDLRGEIEECMELHGPYRVESQGRRVTLSIPLKDARLNVNRDIPYDFYGFLFEHLQETMKEELGGLRFSLSTALVSPRLDKEKGLERGPVQINRCTLLAPRVLPTSADVASFFDISTKQVEATVRRFFCPPPPLYVPPGPIQLRAAALAAMASAK